MAVGQGLVKPILRAVAAAAAASPLLHHPAASAIPRSKNSAPTRGHLGKIGWGAKAAFAHQNAVRRHQRGEGFGDRQINLQSFQIAVVDADQAAGQPEGAGEFRRVMHLNQHSHAVIGGNGGARAAAS